MPTVLLLAALALASSSHAAAAPDVRDIVEFRHLVFEPFADDNEALRSQISPDGRQAFVVTRQGDVASDENRFEILLLDIDESRLASRQQRPAQVLLAVESALDQSYLEPGIDQARWLDDATIVFRARVADAAYQVYALNAGTRRVKQLTFADRSVLTFDVSRDLKQVVYAVRERAPVSSAGARSIVVENKTLASVLFSHADPSKEDLRYQVLAGSTKRNGEVLALGPPFTSLSRAPRISVSPDGAWAMFKIPEPDEGRIKDWISLYPAIGGHGVVHAAVHADPLGYFSTYARVHPARVVLYSLSDGQGRFILDAPDSEVGSLSRQDRLWVPAMTQEGSNRTGLSVVIGGTYLPRETGADRPGDSGTYVIEYWPESASWAVLAAVDGELTGIYPSAGDANSVLIADSGGRRAFRRLDTGQWAPVGTERTSRREEGAWSVRVQQTPTSPPDVVAAGPAGQLVKLTNLNPRFSRAEWGEVRDFHWKDVVGRQWHGGLMLPAEFDPTRRYPLVIQTYGYDPGKFYLDGSNWYASFKSAFPGRAFLREGILVLALPWAPRIAEGASSTRSAREQLSDFSVGVNSAIQALAEEGYVDQGALGVIGFSATARYLEDLLVRSGPAISAATLADSFSNSVFSMVSLYGMDPGYLDQIVSETGEEPYGDSARRWATRVPTHNLGCVTAAVRIEVYGMYLHAFWDTYALLRYQHKPAEMILIPRGQHHLSRPSERMISLQGNVDWYRFWLKGEERTEVVIPGETRESLKEQYERWRQMAELKAADEKKPRCEKRGLP